MTKIPGLKVFPYIVEEAKGSNSKFIFFSVPHLAGGLWEPYLRTNDFLEAIKSLSGSFELFEKSSGSWEPLEPPLTRPLL